MEFISLKSDLIDTGLNFFLEFDEQTEYDLLKNESLDNIKKKKLAVIDFKKEFPITRAKNKYDSNEDLYYRNKNGEQFSIEYNGGCRQFIEDVNIQIDLYIKFINDLIQEKIDKKKVKEFPFFGSWDNLDNPNYFILKHKTLPCLAYFFEGFVYKNLGAFTVFYRVLENTLYQPGGKKYSFNTFKNSRDRALNAPEKIEECKLKGFNEENCLEFLEYIYTFYKVKQDTETDLHAKD